MLKTVDLSAMPILLTDHRQTDYRTFFENQPFNRSTFLWVMQYVKLASGCIPFAPFYWNLVYLVDIFLTPQQTQVLALYKAK